jgi:hypothetical protein
MRRVFSIVLAVGSLTWGGAQAQPAAPEAAPATAPAADPAPAPAAEPAVSPSEPSPASGTTEPPPPPVAPSFPVPRYEKPPEPTEWDQPTFPPAQAARSSRTSEAGFELTVPIYFTSDEGAIDPGFGFAGRFGLVVGRYFVPELHLGWQINWLDDDVVGPYDLTMDTFWVSAGARFRFDNGGLVTPFVSAAFDMNFVHMEGDEQIVCGYYYCDSVANYEFTPGFSGKVGIAFEMSRHTAIDVGVRIAMMFEGDVFPHAEGFVSPFVGLTFYN